MAAPTVTSNQTLRSSASLGAGANASNDLDIRTKFEARIQVKNTGGGTVAATNGLQIDVYRYVDGGTRKDTIPILTFTIPTTVSTEKEQSIVLPTGYYSVKFTNLDVTNAITVDALYETTDTVA
jgi:hypothetical protein